MNLARLGNKYLADTEPWKLAKTDINRAATILHIALQICASCSIAFEPFTPFTAQKLRDMLGQSQTGWDMLGKNNILPEAHPLHDAQLLFDKIDDDAVDAQINKLHVMKAANDQR